MQTRQHFLIAWKRITRPCTRRAKTHTRDGQRSNNMARNSAVSDCFAPDDVIRHAGLVMAQAMNIASVLNVDELICPFAVITKGDSRESIEFESTTQDEAISEGWASLEKYKEYFDLWAFAREGLIRGPDGKEDVLVVAAWTHGMPQPVLFTQRFLPKSKGGFAIVGPMMAQDCPPAELDHVATRFMMGVDQHPQGHRWQSWRRA